MDYLNEGLKILGLNSKESKIFLVLVARDAVTPSELSKMIKIPRTTINAVLPHLEKRGFIERIKVKGHWEWRAIELKKMSKKLKCAIALFEKK